KNGSVVKHIPWTAFTFKQADWERVNNMRAIISDANNIQQTFSDERATLWKVIPALEELQTAWETKKGSPKYTLYHEAIKQGLNKIRKYYTQFDDKPVYILALVIHPYYKLDYIKMAWGGAEQQQREITTGNQTVKNWHNEALQVVEQAMETYW
ncbi:hypothetical protein BS17DRAFT_640875, partial [Gyrodon lividus]